MSRQSDLQKYLYNLVQPYEISTELDKELRQIIWNLLLRSNLLSVCVIDGWGNLSIKNESGSYYKIEDNERFVGGIFFAINKYLNEAPGYKLKQNIIEVREIILLAFYQLEKISNQLAMSPDYKSRKKKFKIPRKEKINHIQKEIRSWTSGLLKGISRHDVEKIPKVVKDKKKAEKVLIEELYFCFRQCCPGLFKKDIYYNMAKIMLTIGQNNEQITKKQINLKQQLVIEAKRIQKIRHRHSCPGGLPHDFWPLIVFPKEVPHQ